MGVKSANIQPVSMSMASLILVKRLKSLRAALFCFGFGLSWGVAAATTVTVTQAAPLETVTSTGEVTGVTEATAGAKYTLVSFAAGQVTLKDAAGLYRIVVGATDYTPPPPAASAAASAAPAPAAGVSTVAARSSTPSLSVSSPVPSSTDISPPSSSSSNSPSSMADSGDASPVPQDKVDAINAGLGKPVFSTASFWSEPALVIAQRLGLALEGRTKWETSYRKYFSGDPTDKDAAMLGTGAYCIALYADADDHPTSLLIAFVNDGDYKKVAYLQHDLQLFDNPNPNEKPNYPDKTHDQLQAEYYDDLASFEPTREAEARTLQTNLSTIFGDPRRTFFGDDPATREDIERWDWNDVSLLLTTEPKKYNLLRIVPTTLADNNGRTERIPRDDIGAKLSGAVEHRPNGDVIITQIPMADQGPKGFCVPATWERVLRYEGVPGDMYTLSRVGSTGFGGGTQNGNLAQELDGMLHNYGRHCEFLNFETFDDVSVRHYIDDGVPIFWSVNPFGYEPAEERYALVDRDKEWDRWKTLLGSAAAEDKKLPPLSRDYGHEVLIIGDNPETKEIAWTDPWGRQTSERWMTSAEAQRCTLGQYYTISW
jgi:hypothetical protein